MGTRRVFIVLLFFIFEVNASCDDYNTVLGTQNNPLSKGGNILRIGVFGSLLDLPESVPLLNLAANVINNQTDLLPDKRHFAYINKSASNALLGAQTLISRFNVTCLIGGVYSSETRIGQLVSRIYQVPELTATPQSTLLSNRVEYPYLVRLNPPDQIQAQAIAQVFEKYNWRQALVFYGDDELGTYGISNLISYTKDRNVTLYSRIITTGETNFSSTIDSVRETISQNNLKIIVIYTQYTEASYLVPQLEAYGYTDVFTYAPMMKYLYTKTTPIPSFTKSMFVTPRGGVPSALRDKYMSLITPGSNSQPDPGTLFYFVDAVYMIAKAVTELMKNGHELEEIGGKLLLNAISSVKFNGTTGPVILDSANERLGEYVWYELNATGVNFDTINAIYNPITATTTYLSDFKWNDGITSPSDGYCLCFNGQCVNGKCVCKKDYTGDSCASYNGKGGFGTNNIIIVVVIPVIVAIIVLILAVKYNKYKKNKLIKDISDRQRSVIKRSDITLKDRIGRGASGEVFRGMFRGTEVAVKKIVANYASQEAISDFELECAIMAGLRHPNIVLFMGSCFVPEQKEMLLVMELMERGSLHDIIHNAKVQLTRDLLLHIAYQAAKGMNFLHQSSPPIIHRDLKSHRITNKKRNAQHELKQKTESLGTIYWTAPEVFQGNPHIEASDCYSFGIVLWEMFHRQTPYGGREPMSVVLDVSNNLRPSLDKNLDNDVRELITECWAASPEARPDFEQIANRLKAMMSTAGLTHQYNKEPQIEAPTGIAYFVFTEIDGAGDLWESIPMAMLQSVTSHNTFMRATLEKCRGYEVEFMPNGFFLAFAKLQDAMNFCISAQKGLLDVDWPAELKQHSHGKVVMQKGAVMWNGLRVKMAIHTGVSNCEVDRATGRVNYFGPVIDRAKKLLYASKQPYSIVVTAAIVDQFTKKGLSFIEEIIQSSCGEMLDTARNKTETIYKILPKSLAAREQSTADNNESLPHTIVLVDVDNNGDDGAEGVPLPSSRSGGSVPSSRSVSSLKISRPSWDIPHEDIEEKEKVGRGSTGDFIHCTWNGQKVVAKVLLNQKVEEEDMLVLKARSSVLSKLKHKNILDFHGVCLDPGHIAVIVGYHPNSGLPALLSDSSSFFTFKQKINIVKQIAEGMDYLASITEHPWISSFSLKSPNILITKENMEVKICDFGQGNLRDLARTMTSVGTVAWTAPEILEGEENIKSHKSTIYSFGIIMWEIMTQQTPYHDQHPIKVVSKILGGYRPPFSSEVPEPYRNLACQCWDANPENRPTWRNILQAVNTML